MHADTNVHIDIDHMQFLPILNQMGWTEAAKNNQWFRG